MALIGYARVSTKGQKLDRQIKKLKEAGCTKIFSDKITGKHFERPGLYELLSYIREGDVIVVSELKRLGRDNKELTSLMLEILSKKATLEPLDLPTLRGIEDENLRRLLNTVIIEIYKYQAQQELEEIRERQQQGIEIAKQKGVYTGRKPLFKSKDSPRLQHGFSLYMNGRTLSEVEELTGINKETFRRYVKKYNIKRNNQEGSHG